MLQRVTRGSMRCPKDQEEFKVFTIQHEDETVQVDVCGNCRGIWLDQDECQQLRRIVQRAGQDGAPWAPRPGVTSYLFQLISGLPMEAWHPVTRFPKITLLFLLACVAVFLYPLLRHLSPGAAEQWFLSWALIPEYVRHGDRLWTLLTCVFLHGSVAHLAGNAYFLYLLGDNTEERLGAGRFTVLLLAAGLFGSIAEAVFADSPKAVIVGASGAIAGVLGAYAVLFPRVKLYQVLFFVRFRITAFWYCVAWATFNVAMATAHTRGIAWMAHLGGFLTGIILALGSRQRSLAKQLVNVSHK